MKSNLLKQITEIRNAFENKVDSGMPSEEIQQHFLGKKGELSGILRQLSELSEEDRTAVGSAANKLRNDIQSYHTEKSIGNVTRVDLSVPSLPSPLGSIHPISAMIEEMTGIFRDLSFEVVTGNEIVTDEENFETLNLTIDHPARDGHDTFYLSDNLLLRTQTTAVQVLEMEKRKKQNQLPIRVVVPGKTYRRESDQTHSPMFHQMDAVVVDTQTTFADLRGTLDYFAKRLFGDTVETRFRPHHFPFTEPSAELDIRLVGGSSTVGKHTDWLEMGGCGMIHPKVLERAGINPKIYQGWAFGMSIERPIMLRHHIPDLRLLFSNEKDFLDQFAKLS